MAQKEKLIRDLTTGSVPGTLLRFAMPLFLSGLLQMVYNMVDMIVVGQMVGTSGLSAVSVGIARRVLHGEALLERVERFLIHTQRKTLLAECGLFRPVPDRLLSLLGSAVGNHIAARND